MKGATVAELENAAPDDTDLHGDPDAMNWAQRFASKVTLPDPDPGCTPLHFAERAVYTDDDVRDLMLPWFASAIETGRMAEAKRAADEAAAARPAIPADGGPLLTQHDHVLGQEMRQAIGEALGMASVCWIPMDCTGVFDTATAVRLVDEVAEVCRRYAECWRADSPKTPADCAPPAGEVTWEGETPGGETIRVIDTGEMPPEPGPAPEPGPPGSSGLIATSTADPAMVAGPVAGAEPGDFIIRGDGTVIDGRGQRG